MVRVPGKEAGRLIMLAKGAPFTPSEISRAIEEMAEPPAPPAAGGPTEPPPIEERERPYRRRRQSNLKYIDERIHEGGVDWIERVAIARPGYRIVGVRHRTAAGHRGRFVVLTQKVRRRRKATNGNGGSHG
jgi:hypothetical protein